MENKLLLIGMGGHCESILDTLLKNCQFSEIGFIVNSKQKTSLHGFYSVGTDDDLKDLYDSGWKNAFVSVGGSGDNSNRKRLFEYVKTIGFKTPTIIDNTSVIGYNVSIGEGTFIGKYAIINVNTTVGENVIINSGAIIEHDCFIGNNVHISSNSTLCGNCSIGNDSHIGAGSVIKQCVEIGKNTTIGIGSVVTKNIENNVVAFGNPCKVVRRK